MLIIAGIVLIIAGVLWISGLKLFSWFGNLPGDIKVEKPGFSFYFPLTSLIVINAVLYFLSWLFRKIF